MNKNLQELQLALSILLERRQAYVDVINKTSARPFEKPFLIPNEKLLDNIEQLIDIITKSIWDDTSMTFHRNRITVQRQPFKNFSAIKNNLFIQTNASINIHSSKN
jgi:hypothetical protein